MAHKKDYLYCLIIGLALSLLAYVLDYRWGNGFLLGLVVGLFHYGIMAISLRYLLQKQSFSPVWFALYFFANMGIFALALLISCLWPSLFNVIACAAGLIMHNLYIYLQALLVRKR
ncbi:MAG: hypothetical protein MR210_08995 [Erysipelotrichaceae bacterium]|nr:hypothetical protein [Erysipelotrichaceae bacterium]MDY5252401.1 hypothetical protein [Erysipelotrichaceae bacterium]